MRILITGATGLLGRTLMRKLGGHELIGTDIADCDLRDARAADRLVDKMHPQVVIHCAAMTAVDECESRRDDAFAANCTAAGNVAAACGKLGAKIIAISTDYVFGGTLGRPYNEYDAPDPRTVYGQSKLAGERAVAANCSRHLIVRTAWLYGQGGPSFVHTMMRLGAQSDGPLPVVDDQIGNPTSCDALCGHLGLLLKAELTGVVHVTCEGEATWCDLAREVFRLRNLPREIRPCATADVPRPAPRPANSRLEKRRLRENGLPPMPDWRAALLEFFREYPEG